MVIACTVKWFPFCKDKGSFFVPNKKFFPKTEKTALKMGKSGNFFVKQKKIRHTLYYYIYK